MLRRRRSLSPRMRELAVIYGHGGTWPVSVAMRMLARADSYHRKVLLVALRRKGASWSPPAPPTT